MIRLSEIAITRIDRTSYRVITPGYTEVMTTYEGVVCLVAADGAQDIHAAMQRASQLLGAAATSWDIGAFLRDALECGILFRQTNSIARVFAVPRILESLRRPGFRSLSVLDICPSDECNLRCSYCTLWKGTSRLSGDIIKRCLCDASAIGVNTVNIIGGEPAVFPELTRDTIAECRALGIQRITVSTNGQELSSQIAAMWRDAGLEFIQLSIDHFDGPGKSFAACKSAIRIACDMFDEVSVAFVYYGQSIQQHLHPLQEALRSFPVRLDLKYAIPHEGRRCPIDAYQIRDFCQASSSQSSSHQFMAGPDLGEQNLIFCGAGNCHAFVGCDGGVKACAYLARAEGCLHEESFSEIWMSKRWSRYCRPNAVDSGRCQTCDVRRWCLAGCLAKYHSRKQNCVQKSCESQSMQGATP